MNSKTYPIKLNRVTLPTFASNVIIPKYDRSQLRQHAVHIGVGGFHRAHQAVYLDDLLGLPDSERWGECGLGVLPSDDRMRDALRGQDHLFTVVERSASVQTARVIGSMVDYIYAPEDREAAIEKLASPETRIVSLTITEGGYFIDEATGDFLFNHPDIQHDLQHRHDPVTSIGLIAEALNRRRIRGTPPFTVMSCDNLQGNGHIIRRVMLAFTGVNRPELTRWIADHVTFPNSMVDRITPATTPADITYIAERFGIADAWPVVTEPFRQWVIEDKFCNGRPQWESFGAQFTNDVASYEIMKMRLLNGSHLAMGYLGAINGFTLVHDVMADPIFIAFIEAFMDEVTPVVPIISGVSIPDYKASLMERFANPTINDQVTRICSEGSAKLPKWLLPSIEELLDRGCTITLLSFVVASWIHYLGLDLDERGSPLVIVDACRIELSSIAKSARSDSPGILGINTIFSTKVSSEPRFVTAVGHALSAIRSLGSREAMRIFLGQPNQTGSV